MSKNYFHFIHLMDGPQDGFLASIQSPDDNPPEALIVKGELNTISYYVPSEPFTVSQPCFEVGDGQRIDHIYRHDPNFMPPPQINTYQL